MKTKNKKLVENQKIKSQNAKKLFAACISKADTGKEVRTEVIGKNFTWNDLSEYVLDTYENEEGEKSDEYKFMVSLFEISRKKFHGGKNTEGLKDFRGHSSHFLVENGKN